MDGRNSGDYRVGYKKEGKNDDTGKCAYTNFGVTQSDSRAGGKFLSRPNLEIGNLQLWSTQVRAQLAKIYGKESKQLAHFLPVPHSLTPQEIQDEMKMRLAHFQRLVGAVEGMPEATKEPLRGKRIFIGHGRSPLWRELKDFINDRLHLPWDEFNRETTAGHTTTARLKAMMADAVSYPKIETFQK